MPCHYEIYPGLNVVLFTYTGTLRADELVAMADKIDADPGYTRTIDELADFRAMDHVDFGTATLANLSSLLMGLYLRSSRNKRIAMVVPCKSHKAAAATFAEVVTTNTPISVRIFESMDPALEFLGLKVEDLPEQVAALYGD